LRAGFTADHALKIADQFGIGMRAGRRADDVEGVLHIGDPVAQGFVHRILQCRRARGDGHDPSAQQFHAENVGLLAATSVAPM
jgi:hypothetical protein